MTSMDINEIIEHLPHGYPFLLIDRVLECVPGERIVAVKNVTFNEPFFTGHFPGRPVMPGVLMIEAMAQASTILGIKTILEKPDREAIYYLVGVDKTRFKTPVLPGDQLVISATIVQTRRGVTRFAAQADVDGKQVASTEILAAYRAKSP